MMVDQISNSRLIEEFLASGGEIRQMPTGASCSRPSTMPRIDRDAFIESRRNYSTAARRNYLKIPQIHKVEAMIERRATRAEIAEYVGCDPDDLFALTEKLERSGVAYPQYLRESMETPFDVLADMRTTFEAPAPSVMKQARFRDLTKAETCALERVRIGINVTVAAENLAVCYDTFLGLISKRFGGVSELRKCKTNAAMLDILAAIPTKGAT